MFKTIIKTYTGKAYTMKAYSDIIGGITKIGDTFIKNIQYSPCITCKYFQESSTSLYQKIPSVHQSKCKKFGYMDIISGKIRYEEVSKARFDKNMCKLEGIYHIKNEE